MEERSMLPKLPSAGLDVEQPTRGGAEATSKTKTAWIALAVAITAAACTTHSVTGSDPPSPPSPATTAVSIDGTYGLGHLPELPASTIAGTRWQAMRSTQGRDPSRSVPVGAAIGVLPGETLEAIE